MSFIWLTCHFFLCIWLDLNLHLSWKFLSTNIKKSHIRFPCGNHHVGPGVCASPQKSKQAIHTWWDGRGLRRSKWTTISVSLPDEWSAGFSDSFPELVGLLWGVDSYQGEGQKTVSTLSCYLYHSTQRRWIRLWLRVPLVSDALCLIVNDSWWLYRFVFLFIKEAVWSTLFYFVSHIQMKSNW